MSQAPPVDSSFITLALPLGQLARFARLWTEAFALTGLAVFIALGWGTMQAGTISIFLVAASLLPRFQQLLHENTAVTLDADHGGLRANAIIASSTAALFLGVLGGYGLVALIRGPEGVQMLFGFALDLVHIGVGSLPGHRFESRQALLSHEYTLLISFFGLAFIYRAYAVTLALAFSGCVWGATLVLAVVPESLKRAPAELTGGLFAIIPTALLESLGILLSSTAAVLISRAIFRYRLQDDRLLEVLRAGLALFAVGGLVHLGAALYEWHVVPALFR